MLQFDKCQFVFYDSYKTDTYLVVFARKMNTPNETEDDSLITGACVITYTKGVPIILQWLLSDLKWQVVANDAVMLAAIAA